MNNPSFHIQSIVEACSRGHKGSRRQLYEQYYSSSYHLCSRYAKNKMGTAFLMEEGWFSVFQNIKKYNSTEPFEHWLSRIFIHRMVAHHKNAIQKMAKKIQASNPSQETTVLHFSALSYPTVLKGIQQLSVCCQIIFCLIVIDHYSITEVEKLLDLDQQTIENCLNKGRAELRKWL